MIKKALILIFVIGLSIAILSVFGNPFRFFAWCFDWIVWSIEWIARIFTGNQTFQEVARTNPGDLDLSMIMLML
jgi:CBS domain containing-hemolysin-like protein